MRSIKNIFNLNDPGWGRKSDGQQNSNSEPPRRPNQDGPPDLDQVWRDFNRRLNGLFGKRGGGRPNGPNGPSPFGSSGGPSPRQKRIGLGVIAAAIVLLWLASGFFIVQEGRVGVITQFGAYKSTAQAGFQWRLPYPFQQEEIVDVSQLRTIEVGFRGNASNKVPPEALMLTSDENIVDVQFVVQYRVQPSGAPDYLFKTRDPDESVQQVAQSSMREVVGRRLMDFVLYEGRTQVAASVQSIMQDVLDLYQTGILVSSVAIQNVQPPEQVQAAFDDAVKAGQDRERQINEGEAYKNQVVPLARGQASRMIEQAEGYRAKVTGDAEGNTSRFLSILQEYKKSPDVMRGRMYLDTMQTMFAQSSKVFIDTEASNSMLYLPLDKIMQQASQGPTVNRSNPMTPAPAVPSPSSQTARPDMSQSLPNTLSRDRTAR